MFYDPPGFDDSDLFVLYKNGTSKDVHDSLEHSAVEFFGLSPCSLNYWFGMSTRQTQFQNQIGVGVFFQSLVSCTVTAGDREQPDAVH